MHVSACQCFPSSNDGDALTQNDVQENVDALIDKVQLHKKRRKRDVRRRKRDVRRRKRDERCEKKE